MKSEMTKIKRVKGFHLQGLGANAFSLLAEFRNRARRSGWKDNEIAEVIKEAQSGDYEHLIQTLMDYED